jgi:hypothetical protein
VSIAEDWNPERARRREMTAVIAAGRTVASARMAELKVVHHHAWRRPNAAKGPVTPRPERRQRREDRAVAVARERQAYAGFD